MWGLIGSGVFGALKNPIMIVVVAVVAFGVAAYSSIKSRMDKEAAIAPWANAVAERDQASLIKDETLSALAAQKEAQDAARKQLEIKLAAAEREANSKGSAPYRWSDAERKLLNDSSKGSYLDTAKRVLSPSGRDPE